MDLSYEELYDQVRTSYESCIIQPLPEEEYLRLLDSYRNLIKAVRQERLWSRNETLEEVATSSLKYFLLDYEFVQLLLNCSFGHRPTILKELSAYLSQFLDRCLAMEAMNTDDRRQYDREEDDPLGPGEMRTLKIKRFKQNKEMKKQLKFLQEKQRALTLTSETQFRYDNYERKLRLIQLQQAIAEGIGLARTVERELELAEMHEKQKARPKRERKTFQPRARPNPGVQFIGPDGRMRKFESLKDFRQNADSVQASIDEGMARAAYGPLPRPQPSVVKHVLPEIANHDPIGARVEQIVNRRENTFKEYVERWKYSVEEGYEFDVASGKVKLDPDPEPEEKKEEDEMTNEEHEAHQESKRAWDAWKDDHKKGAGNPYYEDRA